VGAERRARREDREDLGEREVAIGRPQLVVDPRITA